MVYSFKHVHILNVTKMLSEMKVKGIKKEINAIYMEHLLAQHLCYRINIYSVLEKIGNSL